MFRLDSDILAGGGSGKTKVIVGYIIDIVIIALVAAAVHIIFF